jgi:hypothetical protein
MLQWPPVYGTSALFLIDRGEAAGIQFNVRIITTRPRQNTPYSPSALSHSLWALLVTVKKQETSAVRQRGPLLAL